MPAPFISNPLLDKLPKHLFQFISPQDYDRYTPVNQATWRYVMRQNVHYLPKVAHKSYLEGLQKTGISIEKIPSMYGMNRILKEIGWAAVAVNGFIPPDAFMAFQAYNVLVIASDIRPLEHIAYTPAPDIIHESAGHAPIIANPEYAEYLRRFGEIGAKAISSKKDYELYEAIRHLSMLKEYADTPQEEIGAAEEKIAYLQQHMGEPSEMARIKNLHWWTVEYGLIGTLDSPRIYGAGILSSIGESKWCLSDKVEKLPYTIAAADRNYDITKPQPQLYVTPNFAYLSMVLEEFANTMTLRKGGSLGLQKLIDSKKLGTIELSTGLQISGVFSRYLTNEEGKPVYVQTEGPTALAGCNKELIGHSTAEHPHGFGSPVGKLVGINLAIEDMSPRDLEAYNIYEERKVTLEFQGDIKVIGRVITGTRNRQGKIMLITLTDCSVYHRDDMLFKPDWGIYHMAIGKRVTSSFSGPADTSSFDLTLKELDVLDQKKTPTAKQSMREDLYQSVRDVRNKKKAESMLPAIYGQVEKEFSDDWLLLLDFYELIYQKHTDLARRCLASLKALKKKKKSVSHLIESGLQLLN